MKPEADPKRAAAGEIAKEFLARGDATGWFDALYRSAKGDASAVPWADLGPNHNLVAWMERANRRPAHGARALVVGCGLGDDAEYLASRGWDVTAFDISAEAIAWALRRFPESRVKYLAADLFKPPAEWPRAFDLVFEAYTLQALPAELRGGAPPVMAEWIASGGGLVLIARARDESDPPGELPWPLTKREVMQFEAAGLKCESFEDFVDEIDMGVRRFRAVFRRD